MISNLKIDDHGSIYSTHHNKPKIEKKERRFLEHSPLLLFMSCNLKSSVDSNRERDPTQEQEWDFSLRLRQKNKKNKNTVLTHDPQITGWLLVQLMRFNFLGH